MMQRNMMPKNKKSFLHGLKQVTLHATFASMALLASAQTFAAGTHAISIFGDVKYPADFKHFDYVNPNAPKGGELKLSALGSFDTFNPFLSKGDAAAGLSYLGNSYVWDSLTVQSLDEPFSEYGLIAERMNVAKDGGAVTFYLRKEAKFADGQPVTSEDVRYTFDTLKEKGRPFYDYYYGSITSAIVIDKHTIKFTFSEKTNRELPLIIGQLPILPKHYFENAGFDKADLKIPIGSGPYKIADFKAGKSVTYELRDDYWGKDLPVNRGQHNFQKITYEYFLDDTVSLEAFKGGTYDFRAENTAKNWATAYESPALKAGKIIQEEIKHNLPAGMQGMAFNIRKPIFQDRTLRHAMTLALDFEWSNQNLFYGQYTRTRSYFQNSEMAATGTPSDEELAILNKWRDKLPQEVFTKEYQPPKTNTAAGIRGNLRQAQQMLSAAGYTVKDNQLYNPAGEPIKFEILLGSSAFERIVLPLTRNLKVLGITATVRTVDSNQYLERMRKFDYDMIVATFGQSNSPGNEQRDFWSSAAASRNDSRNVIGIEDPIIDALVETLIQADNREELVTACRALDRVLQWNYYLIPNWHIDKFRVAYRNTLAHPATMPAYGLSLSTWWSRNAK